MDKKWFESLIKTNIEKFLHVEVEVDGNAATILCLAIAFGVTMLLLFVGLAVYGVYRCKVKKPAKKKVCNNTVYFSSSHFYF